MKRFITEKLVEWKNQANRKPLILRGARQVGKTWIVNDFGKNYFNGRVHVVNFEKRPDWHAIFELNFDVKRIVSELEVVLNTKIVAGEDLLFFDEVQSCPRAIMTLRYFYEDLPDQHIISAGSLLEFAFRDIPIPVGRIRFLNMFPLSFPEFLLATGKPGFAEIVMTRPEKLSDTIHQSLLNELRQYFFIGGMPECVEIFFSTGRLLDAFEIQINLADTFRQDFSKYAPYADKHSLNIVFSSVAKSIGRQIKYSHLSPDFSIPTIKKAFELLRQAQVIRKIPAASPAGVPLEASASEKKFKSLMLDIGIMQQLCGLPVDAEIHQSDLLAIHKGALAEQFVGQELVASSGNDALYYWSREEKSSTAEVDYLISSKGRIYPVEIKSGSAGRLRSLHLLLKTFPECPYGIVLSTAPYAKLPDQKLVFLPIYYAYQSGNDPGQFE
ncbi:MAG: AAA family ATPase [Bacteroidota bacterium]